jgi:8-oxo-dGTP pyrophosphatase MutT (NUDIX family)
MRIKSWTFAASLSGIVAIRFEICHGCDPDVRIKKPLAAGCLVRNSDSELLMVQSADDLKWTFPAGNVESWLEKPQEAAARETLEETDITVNVNEAACAVKSFTFPLDIDSFTGYCCSENPAGQNPSSGSAPEIVAAKFLDRDTIANFLDDELRFPGQKQLLLDVIDGKLC